MQFNWDCIHDICDNKVSCDNLSYFIEPMHPYLNVLAYSIKAKR